MVFLYKKCTKLIVFLICVNKPKTTLIMKRMGAVINIPFYQNICCPGRAMRNFLSWPRMLEVKNMMISNSSIE